MRQSVGLLLLLLLAFPAAATEFYDYSFLIPSGVAVDSAKPFLGGSSCAAFDGADFQVARGSVTEEKDFSQALAAAAVAKERLALASGSARMQKAVSPFGIPDVGYRIQSLLCFNYAVESLRAASLACGLGLAVVDERLAELGKAAGQNYSGAAAGVLAEADEAKQVLEEGGSDSLEGFAPAFLAAAAAANASWASFSSSPSATAFVSSLNALVATQSLLREQMLLARKCRDALDALQAERDSLAAEAERALSLAEFKQRELGEQKLFLVSGAEVALAGTGVSSAESAEGSLAFYDAVQEAAQVLRGGRELQSQSNSLHSSKRTGYLGTSILLLREASSLAGRASRQLERVDAESADVEAALRAAVLSRQAEAQRLVSSKLVESPLAAGRAQSLLDAELRDFSAALPRSRGERIAFYARELARLREIIEEASASAAVESRRDRVSAEASELRDLVEDAEDDGIDSSYARDRLARVSAALQAIPSTEEGSLALYGLQDELDAARDDVVAAALEEYGALELHWPAVVEAAEFLSPTDRRKLAEYERFFAGGSLDAEAAAGRLGEVREFVERVLADVDARTPALLKQEFERTASVNLSLGVVPLDAEAKGAALIVLRNDLSLSYAGAVEVSLSGLGLLEQAAYVLVLNKSEEIEVSGKRIFVKGVAAGGEYRALIEFGGVFCRTVAVRESTVWATQSAAEKKMVVEFDCDADARASFEKRVGARVSRAFGEKGVSATAFGETISVAANAAEGRNAVELRYWLANPIEVTRSVSASGGELVFDYVMRSAVALDNAVMSLAEGLSCASPPSEAGVRVFTDLKEKHGIAAESLALELAGDFEVGESKAARVSVQCVSTSAPVSSLDGAVEEAAGQELLAEEAAEAASLSSSDPALAEKQSLMEEFAPAREAAQAALASFEKAFSVGEEVVKKKTSAEQRGALAKKRVETALRALDSVWAKAQASATALEGYSLAYLRARVEDLDSGREALESAVGSARESASQAIGVAEARQKQFGSQQSAAALDAAKQDFEHQMFLSAWLRARAVAESLEGPGSVSSQTGLASAGSNLWLLGVAGLALVAALAWVFWERGTKELKEL
ncbi:MAG: hypothetical protein AB1626_03685 [Candidatus Micrarchaeota archaeon]